jgi:hypothetical protein
MRSTLAVVALLITVNACALDPEADEDLVDDEVDVGEIEQAIDTGWTSGPYTWWQGQSSKLLKPVATHVCVLSKVSGRFAGGSEGVWVRAYNGYWYLGGRSDEAGVNGEAWCFTKNGFLASGTARWVSGEFQVATETTSCTSAAAWTWWGDAATILTGVSGRLAGYGEKLFVVQSADPFTSSSLNIQSCQKPVYAWAHSFFAGAPSSGVPARFYGPEYTADTAWAASGTKYHEVIMAPTGDAMCYLTYIAGDFDGSGEWARIYPVVSAGIERWALRVKGEPYQSGSGPTPIRAKARCMRRDQR